MTKKTKATDTRAQVLGTVQTRELRIDSRAIDEEARTVELAFSSEAPVERWWGREILDHGAKAVRLGRMRDGAPLLLDHRPGQQIGVIESARVDGDRVGRALVRFSRGPLGEEIFQDVRDGIRGKVSVGYMIHEMVLEASKDGQDTYRITDWEPIESSIVSIPADPTVGVGRSFTPAQTESPMDKDEIDTQSGDDQTRTNPEPQTPAAPEASPAAVNPDADAIRAIGAHFNLRDLAEDQIMLGANVQQFRDQVRSRRADPVPVVPRVEASIPHAGNLRAFRPELYAGGRREAEQQAYRAGQWCRGMIFGDPGAARWCRDHGVVLAVAGRTETRVMTGTAPGQAVLVPDELVLPIIDLRETYGLARRLCRIHPMASDTATIPRMLSGATAYFVGRETAPTAGDPGMDNITLAAKNVAAETRLSNDYADDSVINLADLIADEHARAFATKEDSCLINGDGTSTYGGIVGLRASILGLAGAVDGASGHDTFAEMDAPDLRNVIAKLPDIPGIMPIWLTSKVGQNAVFGRLTDAVGGNTKRDLAARMPDQWGGYDIVTSPEMPKVLTDLSDVAMILFGDLRMGVVFGDRRGMTMMVDPYSLSSYQQTKIISSERFDINCHGVGTATAAGPVVALIGE